MKVFCKKLSYCIWAVLGLFFVGCVPQGIEFPGGTHVVKGVEYKMIPVEGGTFMMGSPASDGNANSDEKPLHKVTLSDFSIGETEVTRELWRAVMGNDQDGEDDAYSLDMQAPVRRSRGECLQFIEKLNKKTGKTYRLPTEAEWEYAARGGNKSKGYVYSGSDNIDDVAWYSSNSNVSSSPYSIHPVKTKLPNELGIYDMSGNASEWCADGYSESYYASSPQNNPTGPSAEEEDYYYVTRGGDYNSSSSECRVAARTKSSHYYDCGFRLVLAPSFFVITHQAKDVTDSGATLYGEVYGDKSVTCGIIYGTSPELSETNGTKISTEAEGEFSVTVSGLSANTTYYYCAYVLIDGVYRYGDICSFRTSKIYTVNGVSFNMISVQGGTFTMGGSNYSSDDNCYHQVTLDNYAIGETEVTQELWQAVTGANPSYHTGNSQQPVESVSWEYCQTFIKRLNELTGGGFRLPTEAEWEFAARGGNASKGYTYSGSNSRDDVAWNYNNADNPQGVKTKLPNELGIYDMSGNVREWCVDWYNESYYSSSPQNNPQGPSTGTYRVCRGGDYSSYYSNYIYVQRRDKLEPNSSAETLGLRLAWGFLINAPEIVELTDESVTLKSSIMGLANSETCGFIYGTSSELSSTTGTIVSTTSDGEFTVTIEGLEPNTTYYCRAYVVIDGKYIYGDVCSFNTPFKTYTVNGVSFNMLPVQGGTFTMGSSEVTLSDYAIGETEVTQALWKAVTGANPSYYTGDLQRPVEYVSWNYCQTFIDNLNALTGEAFRLPTEAEWEFAARGGNASKGYTYSGSNTAGDVAWYSSNSSSKTHPVKTKLPNELGIYDMSGNVAEWCADWYYAYSSSTVSSLHNPTGPSTGSSRVWRGGSFYDSYSYCEVSYRSYGGPSSTYRYTGLRLALGAFVNTGGADLKADGATLHGIVHGANESITYGVVYGTSSTLVGGTEMSSTIEVVDKDFEFEFVVNGLSPNTTYYYKTFIVEDGEYKYGDIRSFKTPSKTYTVKGVSFNMISVQGGTFMMGAETSNSSAYGDEKPIHTVTLNNYTIAETEVTQELWEAVMGSNPSSNTGDVQCPVEKVSWDDCQTFISKLNTLTGSNFRLPTEAEWEYAARGGNMSNNYTYSGSNTIDDVAWYTSNTSYDTHSVKTKQPNELGVYDMSGNVSEWCSDWYSSTYYSSSTINNPTGPTSGSARVCRGGDINDSQTYCRVTCRSYAVPTSGSYTIGLRLVQ